MDSCNMTDKWHMYYFILTDHNLSLTQRPVYSLEIQTINPTSYWTVHPDTHVSQIQHVQNLTHLTPSLNHHLIFSKLVNGSAIHLTTKTRYLWIILNITQTESIIFRSTATALVQAFINFHLFYYNVSFLPPWNLFSTQLKTWSI